MYVNWEGTLYNLCKLALNAGLDGLRKMVLLLVSLIEMVWGRLSVGSDNESGRRW
jgi:hypothetical protein